MLFKRASQKAELCQIVLNGQRLDYTLKRSARRKTIAIQINETGVQVVLPERVARREADRVLRDKADWVLKKWRVWAEKAQTPALAGESGEVIGYLGGELRLRIDTHHKARTQIEHQGGELIVKLDETLSDEALRQATLQRALKRWRSEQAKIYMSPKIAKYAQRLNLPEPRLFIRHQKRRWGSCSSHGTIRMNARLMAYAPDLIDYVCAHEVCHLIEMNHSPRFYALLDRIMPDHRVRQALLKQKAPPGVHY